MSREQVDRDVAALRIHELPAAQGCMYVVLAADSALALQGRPRRSRSLGAHRQGTKDPRELKDAVRFATRVTQARSVE